MTKRKAAAVLVAAIAAATSFGTARAQDGNFSEAVELIDPHNLRVCADPASMPFSNDKSQGFENRIAEFLSTKVGKPLTYTWYPMATGFVRKTLGEKRCDVIIGYAQGDELVQNTNAYYRTSYVLVTKPGSKADGVDTLEDPRLKGLRIGLVAGTPPGDNIAINGLMGRVKPYPLMVDTRYTHVPEMMVKDLVDGVTDVAIFWGPIGGYYAKQNGLTAVPLVKETRGPRLTYRITMGVRASDQNWKRQLNTLIRENQKEINAILLEFGVPLLDEKDRPITQ
ncbi:substrate-binding domain-containing protein [Oharaeibacter diazotrophicus]|uniref:Amino acid ABC transporter substrate-binding protein (PAAT family) n=1 Tax=Oharaeibacter diazotrophicus TaxID=1920512 RepID=A0A4R6RLL9_9HYPH|nr:substrate-binding domain-containing protein [Oharaeibacter diazotrophicus]TDP87553.1 amino acid ABC transporter substrate-binding protein (PAAT family) [Oharaeibacter diazotrophicus]BBE70502.1 extracellular solute-binding protein family MxaJ [Pleomorphomonas sp. SM30]GLS77248.1 methanol oxidation protein [Oharaeibacter diazotrophicus]